MIERIKTTEVDSTLEAANMLLRKVNQIIDVALVQFE